MRLLCLTQYYDYEVKREGGGENKVIYRGKWREILSDSGVRPGVCYTYTVTISNTGLEVGSATINDWKQPAPEDFDGNGNATLQ